VLSWPGRLVAPRNKPAAWFTGEAHAQNPG
jgi:hypothetical protein